MPASVAPELATLEGHQAQLMPPHFGAGLEFRKRWAPSRGGRTRGTSEVTVLPKLTRDCEEDPSSRRRLPRFSRSLAPLAEAAVQPSASNRRIVFVVLSRLNLG